MTLEVEQYIPATPLQPFIREYLFIENGSERENRILPDTSIVLSFRYRGQLSIEENNLPAAVLSGLKRSPRFVRYAGRSGNLLVRFKAGGAAAFFSEPLNEWTDQTVPVNFLTGYSDIHQLSERLVAAGTKKEKIALVEDLLLSRLAVAPQPDKLIHFASQKINAAGGLLPIKQLSGDLYISQDAFEKRFRQAVGASPKHYSDIIRFRNALQTHSSTQSLTETALIAGYYDQAHFIKAFKSFTGQAPGQFFRDKRYW